MSTSSTEGGATGQESGGANGNQGQESGAGGGQGQESGNQQQGAGNGGNGSGEAFDFSTIQDPAMRAWAEKVDKDARDARAEAARYRTERNTTQEQLNQLQRANETAEQTAERERQEREQQSGAERERLANLERENRDLRVGGVLTDAARDAKALNPTLVRDMLQAKVQVDADGKPTNVTELLTELRRTDSYLFRRSSTDAGRGQSGGEGSASTTDMNSLIRGAAGRTT